jgi:hypothetical protein
MGEDQLSRRRFLQLAASAALASGAAVVVSVPASADKTVCWAVGAECSAASATWIVIIKCCVVTGADAGQCWLEFDDTGEPCDPAACGCG